MIAVIYGTRPEAIKLWSITEALPEPYFTLCTGQHRELLNGVGMKKPDFNLELMALGQTSSEFIARALAGIDDVLRRGVTQVIVQGDTASAFAGALAAFHRKIPVAHVEAGLRTYDLAAPFPEEGYRQMIDRIAAKLYPPTIDAYDNLVDEGLTHHHLPTGNTGIDAAFNVVQREMGTCRYEGAFVLATVHRREAAGVPADSVCRALELISKHIPVIMPVHPNGVMPKGSGIQYIAPLDYPDLIQTLRKTAFVVTDSGGIQEEAAAFGIPMLITRTTTERQEIVRIGGAKLVGFDTNTIYREAMELLDLVNRAKMSVPTDYYGDGKAGKRIVNDLVKQ
jgi:UDP-N-acetylglucosamine 2-epimerase